ncbi:MAG TPA: hypothetical protein DCS05_03845 [Nitrospiraceae bacterium]|nr:hypothetical protein [Nitrospiraceae bacterium]
MSGRTYTIPQFAQALKKMGKDMRGKTINRAADAGAFVIQSYARINVRDKLNRDSVGTLANSIQVEIVEATDVRVEKAVGPLVIYGRIHELGGVIKAKNKPYLHWVDREGHHHQAKQVTIPARPYLRPTIDEHGDEIIDAVTITLGREIEAAL